MSKIQANDEFQGLCLQSQAGHLHMDNYDALPPLVRDRLRDSPFNICPACVIDYAINNFGGYNTPNALRAIDQMEAMIRCEEVQ